MKKGAGRKGSLEAVAILLPTLLIYTLVIAYPLVNMFYTSFFSWNGIPSSPFEFIGLDNFRKFFSDIVARTALKNVAIIMAVSVAGVIPVALFLATVISKRFIGLRAVKVVYFLPVIINKVAIGLMLTFIFYPKVGPFVKLLDFAGLDGKVNMLGNMNTSIWVCAFAVLWCNTGLHMILFSSSMTQISSEIYDAVDIDGANTYQKMRFVTLPLLRGTISMSAILLLTNAFRVFDLIKALTDGGPGYSSQVLTTLIYKNAFYYGEYGYADTIGVMTVILSLAVMFAANRLIKIGNREVTL